ncbi:MAG TPA: haloacid dehalogenase, partial [Bacteroidales bacterium]|nr:haloacid dehalogenase [Bacteroidales bacterium]
GFVGITYPVRPGDTDAINECRLAGVDVKVVTGDTSVTAKEICRQIGLCNDDKESGLISGEEFAALSDSHAASVIPNLRVMYRARPADKLKLVRLLQEMGEVVAVTGDGTNDAPALNKANVGLAMGSGTSVAKEASDIILLDDSFTSIVNAIRWGRSLYQNIQRFLFFQLTINLLALAIVLFGPLVGVTLPLTVVQMLWVNLIMDTFAALALATEPPHKEVMKQKPRKATDFIITLQMQRWIGISAVSFFVVLVVFLRLLKANNGITVYELTLFFNVFVMLQFWNLFNAKAMGSGKSALSNMGKSKSFLVIAALIFLGQVLIVQFGNNFFRTTPLTLYHWFLIFLSTSIVLWVGELFRFVNRRKGRE